MILIVFNCFMWNLCKCNFWLIIEVMIVNLGNLKVHIRNVFQWHESNANCQKICCFQRCNQVTATKHFVFSTGSPPPLLARKVGYTPHSEQPSVISIEHTSVIQNIPIFVSKFIKPKYNWLKISLIIFFKPQLVFQ